MKGDSKESKHVDWWPLDVDLFPMWALLVERA